jgi:hypothetical protein
LVQQAHKVQQEIQGILDTQVRLVTQEQLDTLVQLETRERLEAQVRLVKQEQLDTQEQLAIQEQGEDRTIVLTLLCLNAKLKTIRMGFISQSILPLLCFFFLINHTMRHMSSGNLLCNCRFTMPFLIIKKYICTKGF